jgi:hypothetical protein
MTNDLHETAKSLSHTMWQALEYYGNPCLETARAYTGRGGANTLKALQSRGLIESCETHPYYRTTRLGGLVRTVRNRYDI